MIIRFLIASLCGATFCAADANTSFRDIKRHLQVGASDMEYVGGSLGLNVFDGGFTLGQCLFDPSFEIVVPQPFCSPGTQGLIAAGDIDGDGVRDAGLFWAVTAVQRATQIEPFRTDRVQILAAPPSGIADILRTSNGDVTQVFEVRDTSVIIWWDVLDFATPIQQYDITQFDGTRPYGSGDSELARQYYDLPWGSYLFSYPVLDDPQNPFDDELQLNFGVTHFPAPDVFPGRGLIPEGWRANGPDDVWVEYETSRGTFDLGLGDPVEVTGALEIDPKNFFQIVWEGIDTNNAVGLDSMFFSIVGNYQPGIADLDTGECILVEGEEAFGIVFPPYSPCTPESQRDEILIGTFDGRVDMPPFFFQPGDFLFAHLRFVRAVPAGAQTTDRSQRSLYIPLSMVENWVGFATFTAPFSRGGFPFGTAVSDRDRYADFDLDGATNLAEFALDTNLDDKDDVPPAIADQTVPLPTTAGDCTLSIDKRPFLTSTISFTFEYSMDTVTWIPISPSDPDWEIVSVVDIEAGTEMITVTNLVDMPGTECFLRVDVRDRAD